jgi:alpha-glucosidase
MGSDVETVNVQAERSDPGSMLTLYRRLLALRRDEPALSIGSYVPLGVAGDVLAYERRAGSDAYLVVLNLGAKPGIHPPGVSEREGTVVLSTNLGREGQPFEGNRPVAPAEGLIVRLSR